MAQASGAPLTKCPICRYDLTGLPANHRCPECGFEYDETMRTWQTNDRRLWQVVLFSLVATAVMLAVEGVFGFSGRRGLIILILSANLAAAAAVLRACLRREYFIVLGRRGILVVLNRRLVDFHPWPDLELRGDGPPETRRIKGRMRPLVLPTQFMRPDRLQELHRAICDFAARYGVATPDIPRLPEFRWPQSSTQDLKSQ